MASSRTRPTLLCRLRDASDCMAWEEFFACYWPTIHGYARHRGCSEQTAEEVVQDVMLKVFERRDVFCYDPQRGRFRDWLRRVVMNRIAERRRRLSDRERAAGGDGNAQLEPLDDHLPPDDAWEEAFERSLLSAMVNTVRRESNPRDFVAFELTMLQGRRPDDVAAITGMTRNMVYKARRKILERLRELCGSYADDGRLCREVRAALESHPPARVERSLTRRIEKTMSRA